MASESSVHAGGETASESSVHEGGETASETEGGATM